MRARMALLVAGIEVELREVVLRDRPEHMLEISPKGTVPVLLLDDGTVIEESMDIMLWALDESYFVGDWEQLVDGNDGDFKHHLDRYKYNNRYENPLSPEEHRSHVVEFLEGLQYSTGTNNFLCGQDATSLIMPCHRLSVNLPIQIVLGSMNLNSTSSSMVEHNA